MHEKQDDHLLTSREREDFWLEVGPPSAYYGTDSEDAARREGDASPDAERLAWPGAEPRQAVLPPYDDPALPPLPTPMLDAETGLD